MRQYPRLRKTLRYRNKTVTQLKSKVSGGITCLLSGGTLNREKSPLIKKTLKNRIEKSLL